MTEQQAPALTVESHSTTEQRQRYHRSEELLRKTLSMLCNFIWTKRLRTGEHLWSIPVDFYRDFDCILDDAIEELVNLRKAVGSDVVGPLMSTTLTDGELIAAVHWREEWLRAETEESAVYPEPLDPQIIAYLVADAEQLRKIDAAVTAGFPSARESGCSTEVPTVSDGEIKKEPLSAPPGSSTDADRSTED